MKISALAAAIAATTTLTTGAHAAVSSAINAAAIELYIVGINIEIDCANTWNPGFTTGLTLSGAGTGPGQINFLGDICLDPATTGAPYVALDIALNGGAVAGGTEFTGGDIDIYADFGSGWAYAYTVTATVTAPATCVATATATGLQWAGGGVNTLPGPFANPPGNQAVCEVTALGFFSSLYLTGTNTD
jgi:hypothetical protein